VIAAAGDSTVDVVTVLFMAQVLPLESAAAAKVVGFAQLFPSFDSTVLRRTW